MPNPNIEEKTTKRRKCPILGSGEISSAYEDIYEVQRYLRHKYINTTKHYIHSTDETQMRLVKAMNTIFISQ